MQLVKLAVCELMANTLGSNIYIKTHQVFDLDDDETRKQLVNDFQHRSNDCAIIEEVSCDEHSVQIQYERNPIYTYLRLRGIARAYWPEKADAIVEDSIRDELDDLLGTSWHHGRRVGSW